MVREGSAVVLTLAVALALNLVLSLSFPQGNPLFDVSHSTNIGCPVLARARAGYHEPHPLPPRPPPTTCHLERSRSRICDPRSRKIRGCSCLCSCPCLCSCRCSSFCHSPQGIRFSASVIPQTPGAPFNTQPHRVLGGTPPTSTALRPISCFCFSHGGSRRLRPLNTDQFERMASASGLSRATTGARG